MRVTEGTFYNTSKIFSNPLRHLGVKGLSWRYYSSGKALVRTCPVCTRVPFLWGNEAFNGQGGRSARTQESEVLAFRDECVLCHTNLEVQFGTLSCRCTW